VRIIGVPSRCPTGLEPWRAIAGWVQKQLTARFGDQVVVEYYDLFSPEMDRFPEMLALVQRGGGGVPLVLIGEEILSSGGKVSVPAIRRALEARGLAAR